MAGEPIFDINTLNRESEFVTVEGKLNSISRLDENRKPIPDSKGMGHQVIYAYATKSTTRIPKEILINGNIEVLNKYINDNPHKLDERELRHLKDRVKVMEHVNKLEEYHKEQNRKPQKKIVKRDVYGQRAYLIDGVSLEKSQSSGMGCWSCSLMLQLQAKGVKVDQEVLRRMKPEYKLGKGPINSPHEIDIANGNSMNEIYQNSEIVGKLCPNTMVKKMDISSESLNKTKIINKVKSTVFSGNPVSYCNGAHWLTIVGFNRNNQFYYYDSNNHNNPGQLKVGSFDTFRTGHYDFTWLENIELNQNGKMKNVPEEYFDVDESGVIVSKITEKTEGAFLEDSPLKINGNFYNNTEDGIPISTYVPHSIRYYEKDYKTQKNEIENFDKINNPEEQQPEEVKYSFMSAHTEDIVNNDLKRMQEEGVKLLKKSKEEEKNKPAEKKEEKKEEKKSGSKKSLYEEMLEAQRNAERAEQIDFIDEAFKNPDKHEFLFEMDDIDRNPPVRPAQNDIFGLYGESDNYDDMMDNSLNYMSDKEFNEYLKTGQINRKPQNIGMSGDYMSDRDFEEYLRTGRINRSPAYNGRSGDYMSDEELAVYMEKLNKAETKKPSTSSEGKGMAKKLNEFVNSLAFYSEEDKNNVAADSEAYGALKKSVGILSDYYKKWKSVDQFPKEIKEEAKALWNNIRQNAISSTKSINGIIDEYGSMEALKGTEFGEFLNGKVTLCQQIADAAAAEAEKLKDAELERRIKSETEVISKIDNSITNDKKHKLAVVENLKREMGLTEFKDIEPNIDDFRERYSWAVSNIVELMVEGIKKEKEANPDKTDIDFKNVKIQIGRNDLASLAACTFAENLAIKENFNALKKDNLPEILYDTAKKFKEFDNSMSATIEFTLETFFSGGKLYKTFGNKIEEAYKDAMSKQIEEKQNSVTEPKVPEKGEKVKTENKKTEPEKTESGTKEVKSLNNDETVKQLV